MNIDKIDFPIYGVIILISLLIGILFNYIYLKRNNIENQYILLFSVMLLLFAVVGGEMINFLSTDTKEYRFEIFGLSSYGGAIGVILASIIFEKINPKDKIFIKSAVLSLPLIYSISKLACFFSGCCYGLPYNSIFSVTYTSGLNIPLIPVQLIETITFMIIFMICILLRNNKNIMSITIILSALSKFLLDFFRYNHLEEIITKNQISSIIFVIIGMIMIIKKSVIKKKSEIINNLKDPKV